MWKCYKSESSICLINQNKMKQTLTLAGHCYRKVDTVDMTLTNLFQVLNVALLKRLKDPSLKPLVSDCSLLDLNTSLGILILSYTQIPPVCCIWNNYIPVYLWPISENHPHLLFSVLIHSRIIYWMWKTFLFRTLSCTSPLHLSSRFHPPKHIMVYLWALDSCCL